MDDSAAAFSTMGTLGVEEEFYVVDAAGRPTAGTDTLVHGSEPPAELDGRLDHELFKCIIEVQTPTVDSIAAADGAVRSVRGALVEHARDHGYRIAGAGLHPLARWRELEHAEKPRYRSQLDRIRYPQHRNTTAGLHIHVGVDDADKATWIANRVRWHLPILLAVAANSPFWNGYDTGLASARAKIFEALPNTGLPGTFDDFAAYRRFERRMVETGSVADRGELWYDVRPHTEHGTVEIRAPDGQSDPDRTTALVEYAHALVVDLAERYADRTTAAADGGSRSRGHDPAKRPLRRELLDENKWRALRYGHDARLIDRDGHTERDLGEIVDREGERLGVSGLCDLYDAESGTERQRRLAETGVDALCEGLVLDPS
ncbi:carboxylate--amine ligase [Halobacteriales archaeon SW_7_68_16]|nr:MAG: carboxylate--amine ligase [Halobacteriales archaeon SW_7_68_16]